jgi:hypothetical protein
LISPAWSGLVESMSTTITHIDSLKVSRTTHSTTYENAQYEIVLAVVYRRSASWRAACYFGPGDDDCDEEIRDRRNVAERIALAHAQALTDAL